MKDFAINKLIRGLAAAAGIYIPSSLSITDLYNYTLPSKDGLPEYTNFNNPEAEKALNALCTWFEKLDEANNQDQIEKIARTISDNVRGPGKVYNFFVKVMHHEPSRMRLCKTGVIKYIGENPELVEPLMGIIKGKKVSGAVNLLEFEAAQIMFDVYYKDGEAYYNARSLSVESPHFNLSPRSTSLSNLSQSSKDKNHAMS